MPESPIKRDVSGALKRWVLSATPARTLASKPLRIATVISIWKGALEPRGLTTYFDINNLQPASDSPLELMQAAASNAAEVVVLIQGQSRHLHMLELHCARKHVGLQPPCIIPVF